MKKRNIFNVMAIAAVSFFGLTTCVNAESYIVDKAPDTFTTRTAGQEFVNGSPKEGCDATIANTELGIVGQQVIDYHATTGEKLFCIDRKIEYRNSQTYTKTTENVDYGIVYIIVNSEKYFKELSSTSSYKNYEQSWFTQVAIWHYLDSDNSFKNINVSKKLYEAYTSVNGDYLTFSDNADKIWNEAKKLAEDAKSAKSTGEITSFNMSFDGNYTVLEDSKSVKTGLFGLADSNNITTYSIDLKNAPSGTKAYTESGSEITDLTSIPAATKLYLVIPVENIENYSFEFDIPASTNNYKFYTGYKYVSDGSQPLTLVVPTTKQIDSSINFKSSKLEDTASSISNSIYFIGFMILLGGMGIIYANTKERKEQV